MFELGGSDKVRMVRSLDGFYSFDFGKAYSEPNITRREFGELIHPMLISALGSHIEDNQALITICVELKYSASVSS